MDRLIQYKIKEEHLDERSQDKLLALDESEHTKEPYAIAIVTKRAILITHYKREEERDSLFYVLCHEKRENFFKKCDEHFNRFKND